MLYTQEAGPVDAPTILLLHGGGLSSRMWQPQFDRLKEFHLLAPDLPEQGKSCDVTPFTLRGAAEAVAEVLRERTPDGRAHVVGLSLGGAVALEMARLFPQQVASLMVTGTAAGLSPMLGKISLASAGIYNWLKPETLVKLSYTQFGIPPEYHELVHDDLAATATEAFTVHLTQALMEMQLPADYQGPALFMVGSKETIPAKQAARKLVSLLPQAIGKQVPGQGHVWNLSAADLFSAVVRAWVTGAPLPSELLPLKS